jgi:4-amino-4-deoxy-L-arabinose transferase-like glycosyltransferase
VRSALRRLPPLSSGLWLLLGLALLRAPGFVFGVLDIDESDLVVMGRMIGKGALPYLDFVEKKPLFLYLFYVPGSIFGFEIWPTQLLGLLWVFATCVLVGRAAREWTGRRDVGIAAAWLAALASSCNVLSVNAELLLNLPAAAALFFFVRAEKRGGWRSDLFAGLCIAGATLFKHQAGILLVAMALALVWRRSGGWLSRLAALFGGFCLPWAAVAGLYAARGELSAFYEWNVARNLFYSSYGAGSAWERFAMGLLLYVVAATPLLWFYATRETLRGRGDPVRFGLVLLLWLTWIPIALGGRFYAHYYLQFIPPLALLAAPGLADAAAGWKGLRTRARVGIAAALAIPLCAYLVFGFARGALGRYPAQEPKTIELARFLREKTAPTERLFVWGDFTPIYYLAERLPGTRYLNTAVHMGDFDPGHLPAGFDLRPFKSERDIAATLRDLDEKRPEIAVNTAPADIHHWGKVPLEQFPEIAGYLARHYEPIGTAGGAKVYRRRLP